MSQVDAPQPSATQPAEPKKGSPVRLIVLLGILAVVLTGFLVDLFWMYDQVKAASERLQNAADAMAQRPREEGKAQFLSREDVAKAIGFQPTNSAVDENGQLIEHYRWWGPLPLRRRFIVAKYKDSEGKNYVGYDISNRDIFGRDEEEAMEQKQPPASSQPVPPAVPGQPEMPLSGVSGPPGPGSGESKAESSNSESEKDKASDGSEEKPEEKPAEEKSAEGKPAEEKPADADKPADSADTNTEK